MKTTEELKNLLYKNETVADAAPDAIAAAQDCILWHLLPRLVATKSGRTTTRFLCRF